MLTGAGVTTELFTPKGLHWRTTNQENLLLRKGMRGMVGYSTSPAKGDTEKKIPTYCLESAIRNLLNS